MYQPDTDDLIPRCAPKPSASEVNEATVRPSVPEVSIVFSQPESLQPSSSTPPSTTSYAAWKKQCLPQVAYPSPPEMQNAEFSNVATRSSVYPMRTAASVVPTINAASAQFSLPRSEPSNVIKRSLSVPAHPHSNIESPMVHCNPTYTVTTPCCKLTYNSDQQRNLAHMHAHSMDTNILTICAGTQTDTLPVQIAENHELDIESLATKADVAQIRTMLIGMRTEQRRLIEVVQHLLVLQGKAHNGDGLNKLRNVSTQCDAQPTVGPLPQKRPHIRYDSIEEEDSTEEDDSYRFQKKTNVLVETPPKMFTQLERAFRSSNNQRPEETDLSKPATEQSMVMNELALKYLPNEKLSELLQDLHVSPITAQPQKIQKVYDSPLKNIENYGKSPIDLSTASYKYLKKYRLLPEENNNTSPSGNTRKVPSPPNQQENMLDLETIRRQPKFM